MAANLLDAIRKYQTELTLVSRQAWLMSHSIALIRHYHQLAVSIVRFRRCQIYSIINCIVVMNLMQTYCLTHNSVMCYRLQLINSSE
jgi:hypothetical protein